MTRNRTPAGAPEPNPDRPAGTPARSTAEPTANTRSDPSTAGSADASAEWVAWARTRAAADLPDPDHVALAIRLAPADWLPEVLVGWGPLPWDDLRELALADRDRLQAAVAAHLRPMIAAVLADARAVGVAADAVPLLGEGLEVRLGVDWDGTGGWQQATGRMLAAGDDVTLLAWVAEGIQEVTMERDQRDCRVWPVCPRHGLGGHVRVRPGAWPRPVWWCHGGGPVGAGTASGPDGGPAGHELAAVGELGRHRRPSRH